MKIIREKSSAAAKRTFGGGQNVHAIAASKTLRSHTLLATLLCILFVFVGLATKAESSEFKMNEAVTSSLNWNEARFDRKRLKGNWNLGLTMDSYTEGKSEALTTQFKAQASAKYIMGQSFDFLITGGVSARVGRVQENFERTNTGNSLFLKEALFRFTPYNEVNIDAGVVSQSHFQSDLLISGGASFPGLRQSYEKMFGELKLKVWAQQVIPTSSSFDTDRVEKEPFPYLLTETLELSTSAFDGVDVSSSLTVFDFNGLPSKIAAESDRLGNVVLSPGEGTAKFKYDFQGVMLAGDIEVTNLSKLPIIFRPSLLQNLAADSGFSNAQNLTFATRIVSGASDFEPYATYFFAESDATVAAYSSSRYGQTNRQGFFVGMKAKLPKFGFAIKGEVGQMDTINPDAEQDRIDTVMVQLETLDAIF